MLHGTMVAENVLLLCHCSTLFWFSCASGCQKWRFCRRGCPQKAKKRNISKKNWVEVLRISKKAVPLHRN